MAKHEKKKLMAQYPYLECEVSVRARPRSRAEGVRAARRAFQSRRTTVHNGGDEEIKIVGGLQQELQLLR